MDTEVETSGSEVSSERIGSDAVQDESSSEARGSDEESEHESDESVDGAVQDFM